MIKVLEMALRGVIKAFSSKAMLLCKKHIRIWNFIEYRMHQLVPKE